MRDTSPLGPLLRALSQHAGTLGVLIALGEIAVGVATLLGVRVRLAAAGGALISLSLLLTVTWATRPYYYGSDVVFLVCWLPLVVFGDGGLLSLEAALARRAATRAEAGPDRRALLAQAVAVAVTAGLAGAAALVARGARRPPAAPAAAADPGRGRRAGHRRSARRGGGRPGRRRSRGDAARAVARPRCSSTRTPGTFVAFRRTCTHAGCTVDISPDGRTFRCPCHGAVFDAGTGSVLAGPAPAPLPGIPVRVVGPDVLADD